MTFINTLSIIIRAHIYIYTYIYIYIYTYTTTATTTITTTDTTATTATTATTTTTTTTTTTKHANNHKVSPSCKGFTIISTTNISGSFASQDFEFFLQDSSKGGAVEQGVVMYMMLYTSLLYNTTPIHCTPLRLHPLVMNAHFCTVLARNRRLRYYYYY